MKHLNSEDESMAQNSVPTRRKLLLNSSAALVVTSALRSAPVPANPFAAVSEAPGSITAFTESGPLALNRTGAHWHRAGVDVRLVFRPHESAVFVRSPETSLLRVHLRWQFAPAAGLSYLGDHWERSYGDLAWRHMEPERVLPWYFLATTQSTTHACGVKTAPAAFCFWRVDPDGVSLWLDLRNGGRGVKLGDRELLAATVVTDSYSGVSPFAAAVSFCRKLCDKPRLPLQPVYGGNNWYYAYGKSSAQDIRADSERIASLASNTANKPFMVIDDGWQPNPTAGPWSTGNAQFPDMAQLARDMRRIGVQPGLWVRPLFTRETVPDDWHLASPNAAREAASGQSSTLDPTVPEALEKIRQDIRTIVGWGYTLVKHDFSTYDLLGRWGSTMGARITDDDWAFHDKTRTNAEVIRAFYTALREAAGDTMLLGCNTIGHLTAGLFELQRTGDDTSGRDWNRTRKMGVNTLAFRAPQHNAFFAIDADCVGLTRQVPWTLNRQWLDLLARSGTPLFVSASPDATGVEQRRALQDAFRSAAQPLPLGEPLDWLENNQPQRWSFAGHSTTYDWFAEQGSFPFSD